jgi:hypothetical protein
MFLASTFRRPAIAVLAGVAAVVTMAIEPPRNHLRIIDGLLGALTHDSWPLSLLVHGICVAALTLTVFVAIKRIAGLIAANATCILLLVIYLLFYEWWEMFCC